MTTVEEAGGESGKETRAGRCGPQALGPVPHGNTRGLQLSLAAMSRWSGRSGSTLGLEGRE